MKIECKSDFEQARREIGQKFNEICKILEDNPGLQVRLENDYGRRHNYFPPNAMMLRPDTDVFVNLKW